MTHKAIASCCNQGIQVTKIDNQGAGSGIDLTALKRHPYSALFSRYDQDEDDRQEMAHSIKNVGLLSPVTMCQNEVLDGWNSLQACKIAGVTPVFEDLAPGLDAWEFVKAKNLLRRHMTPVVLALVAKLAGLALHLPAVEVPHHHLVRPEFRINHRAGPAAERACSTTQFGVGYQRPICASLCVPPPRIAYCLRSPPSEDAWDPQREERA